MLGLSDLPVTCTTTQVVLTKPDEKLYTLLCFIIIMILKITFFLLIMRLRPDGVVKSIVFITRYVIGSN